MLEPYRFEVPAAQWEDLRRRLDAVRALPPPVGRPPDSGIDHVYLSEMIAYWAAGFDWEAQQSRLDAFPQFMADLGDGMIHLVWVKADRDRYPEPTPMILSHGWPYSFVEMLPIVPWLVDPVAHGGETGDACDLVIPSLPGYAHSPALRDLPFTADIVARLWHRLMTEVLGYERYVTYGEDVGTTVSDWTAALHPEAVAGLFATHAAFPPDERLTELTADEERFRGWLDEKWQGGTGYSAIQSTRPDTLAVALGDSPAGMLAWMAEKVIEWSGPSFEEAWTRDDILTMVTLYWFTECIGTSFLPYFDARFERPLPMIDVPVGVAVQWGERGFPREYAERTYRDIRTWSQLPEGGHFTVKQSPALVAGAMWEFLRLL